MSTDRKISYKVPPTAITDELLSQDARRSKALKDQKRRRAQKVDSFRQLDLFADLNLGPSDDEEGEVIRQGVASFASMVGPSHQPESSNFRSLLQSTELLSKNGRRKGRKKQRKADNPGKWANKCMYAELLEMKDDSAWPLSGDSLPNDLESGWVAVAPVPVGKRCLAVTHQSSGIIGVVPNTSLRSRVLGKSLLQPFPSNLPPQTVLDCILDPNWRDNGILHVLDVLQWKGQDVGDCETPFRFWWRDTRLAELPSPLPPSNASATSRALNSSQNTSYSHVDAATYHFPYPVFFLTVPYHTNTTLPYLASYIIPLARSLRLVSINVPTIPLPTGEVGPIMEVDDALPIPPRLTSVSVALESDGMLLYVSQASYESGTSPLSSWIPITGYSEEPDGTDSVCQTGSHRPLNLFERLVTRRLLNHDSLHGAEVEVDMEPQ